MRDCALVLYKYAFFFVPECGVPRQVVQRLSIGPAPSGAFPLVRVRCRPGALLLLFFFSLPSSSFFLISPRLDFSFYNVVIPELCFLFYNNRGHYTGLILVCIPLSVFKYFKLPPRAQRPSGERPEALTQEENGLSYGQQTLTISVLLVLEEKRKRSEFPKTMDKC